MDNDDDHIRPLSPFNVVPATVWVLALAIIGIEVVFQLANFGLIGGPRGVGWRVSAVEQFGYSGAVLDRVMVQGDYSFSVLRRFVTYAFVNAGLMPAIFCTALTLALGKFATEYYGALRVVVIYFAAAIVGAVVFGLLVDTRFALVGSYTPVYGLIGAYTYALWLKMGKAGENQLMAFRLIGFLLMIQLVFGLIFGGNNQWVSELSGFFAGFALAIVLAPGGWARLLTRLRERS